MVSSSREEKESAASKDVIEIPVGKLKNVFGNGWRTLSLILGIVVIVLLFMQFSGGGITGNVIAEDVAAQNLIDFVNAQGSGEASVVNVERVGALYQITISYNGENVPVFVSLDGEYAVLDPIPLGDSAAIDSAGTAGSGTGTSAQRKTVDIGDAPVKGEANAPVTIVEFTDYECPFCGRHYSQTYTLIESEYIDTGKVKYVLMDFPLSFHPQAQKAAESAHCVRAQKGDEGYFAMHDKLFANQASLSLENYKKWAREITGVNGAKFDTCLDSGEFADEVQAGLTYGSSLGISGTPGFFINGIPLSGAQPYSAFKQIIDAELEGEA